VHAALTSGIDPCLQVAKPAVKPAAEQAVIMGSRSKAAPRRCVRSDVNPADGGVPVQMHLNGHSTAGRHLDERTEATDQKAESKTSEESASVRVRLIGDSTAGRHLDERTEGGPAKLEAPSAKQGISPHEHLNGHSQPNQGGQMSECATRQAKAKKSCAMSSTTKVEGPAAEQGVSVHARLNSHSASKQGRCSQPVARHNSAKQPWVAAIEVAAEQRKREAGLADSKHGINSNCKPSRNGLHVPEVTGVHENGCAICLIITACLSTSAMFASLIPVSLSAWSKSCTPVHTGNCNSMSGGADPHL